MQLIDCLDAVTGHAVEPEWLRAPLCGFGEEASATAASGGPPLFPARASCPFLLWSNDNEGFRYYFIGTNLSPVCYGKVVTKLGKIN